MTRTVAILPILPAFAILVLSIAAAADAPWAPAAAPASRPAVALDATFELPDVGGDAHRPLQAARAAGAKAIVFLFIATDCPISNSYAPEFNRICSQYGRAEANAGAKPAGAKPADAKPAEVGEAGEGRGAREARAFDFYLVHADPDLLPADARKHASDYGYGCPVLMDSKKELAAKLGAKTTPEAVVLAPDGSVLYRGRIDDQYAAYGKRRSAPTTRDLRNALDAILAEKPVAVAETKVIGCPIE